MTARPLTRCFIKKIKITRQRRKEIFLYERKEISKLPQL